MRITTIEAKAIRARKKQIERLEKQIGGVDVLYRTEDGIKVTTLCKWADEFDCDNLLSYKEECKKVIAWCEEHDVHYYGRPNEYLDDDGNECRFSEYDGIQEARVLNKKGVLLDNLS